MKMTFALFFGNRGFFPEHLIAAARSELHCKLTALGFDCLLSDAGATRHGAVETPEEGAVYAQFLRQNAGKYDGVILCLPNFGDENGAVAALRDCKVPIFILAYPDEPAHMDFHSRRDAFCGKFSIMNVFLQNGIAFTAFTPHVLSPGAPEFAAQINKFAGVCRVVNKLRNCRVGAVGARTGAFKTVRFDEIALQRHGITTETFDLSEIIHRVRQLSGGTAACRRKRAVLLAYSDFQLVPAANLENLVKLAVVLDELVVAHQLDALAIRCWMELEEQLQISPCVILSELNERRIPAACEVDVANAIAMLALERATDSPAGCMDWNNNYGDDPERCILFHCGPIPASLLRAPGGLVTDHPMFAKTFGAGCGFGCNTGRLAAGAVTFASLQTRDGRIQVYCSEGEITDDPLPPEFFGCGGVIRIPHLQERLLAYGRLGYRHHVSIAAGNAADILREAFRYYLDYDITPQPGTDFHSSY